MQYVHLPAPGKARLVRAPEIVELPGGHVRIAVAYVGLCHSDLATAHSPQTRFPLRLGHEVSGEIIESSHPDLPVGLRVAAQVQDGYASEVIVPSSGVIPLDPGCDLLDGALAEPLACVIGGLDLLDLRDIADVVIIGSGFMGLLAARYLLVHGHRVTVVEPRESARAAALQLGVARAIHPFTVAEGLSREYPVLIEATGAESGLALASDLLAVDGTLAILGYHQSAAGTRTVPMQSWNYRALRILNLHNRDPRRLRTWMDRAQRCSAQGIIRPSELVDRIIELSEVPQMLAHSNGLDGIKTAVQVTPDDRTRAIE